MQAATASVEARCEQIPKRGNRPAEPRRHTESQDIHMQVEKSCLHDDTKVGLELGDKSEGQETALVILEDCR